MQYGNDNGRTAGRNRQEDRQDTHGPRILCDHYIRADIIAARHIAETIDRIHEEEKLAFETKDEPRWLPQLTWD